ncbi:MAG: efflux RND transporter permease subunit, partial [Clostridia bacterium]|nr:efflux RND transporter permease subunit [Clostridia bacterium]
MVAFEDEVPAITGILVETPEDAENLVVPEVGAARTGLYVETIRKACELITDRPVFAGVIGLVSLPVEQYPDIAPPTINVSTSYPGASAETIQKAVIAPLEEQINGVENMTYMTSTASNTGSVSIS